ncbi:hypothetical protein [Methylocystis rosea]|uniref:Uncharacterized protein n=1 Tax=Methylocystis rosea TaxID=173366 RepID=A0A3G8M1V0_9HYPH|nr:hypothetical protein [Methylocystis rosea]AZG75901.1 hypothetical protein EHO51_03645 [Methylocystis rosea]
MTEHLGRNELAPKRWGELPSQLHRWFSEELGSGNPIRSIDQCVELATEIRKIVNAHENARLRASYSKKKEEVPLSQLKDVTPSDVEAKKRSKVADHAVSVYVQLNELSRSLTEIEKFYGCGYRFGDLSVSEFQARILEFKLDLMALGGHGDPEPGPSRGDHSTPWHHPAKEIGEVIKNCLTQLGYRGSKSLSDEASASVVVATRTVNHVFEMNVSPAGFVSAMRSRDRKQRRSADQTPLDSILSNRN